ncbi:hypothetical protein GCM10010168_60610 [Actinoplanes ianthinogenes]|uniref:Uncharacterized protein n=1 Tax=Actinoplanes ianthinogenes TaxID=122358 RepID=A0ABM7M4C6_9ACTN|nr:hypothetical protein Aiant_70790 [Actinoplanes ianthinogenes]GGR34141.1 hypothetical protein GCM10010168_60610 [Actinoplanes ianthinogenes]
MHRLLAVGRDAVAVRVAHRERLAGYDDLRDAVRTRAGDRRRHDGQAGPVLGRGSATIHDR